MIKKYDRSLSYLDNRVELQGEPEGGALSTAAPQTLPQVCQVSEGSQFISPDAIIVLYDDRFSVMASQQCAVCSSALLGLDLGGGGGG